MDSPSTTTLYSDDARPAIVNTPCTRRRAATQCSMIHRPIVVSISDRTARVHHRTIVAPSLHHTRGHHRTIVASLSHHCRTIVAPSSHHRRIVVVMDSPSTTTLYLDDLMPAIVDTHAQGDVQGQQQLSDSVQHDTSSYRSFNFR